MSGSYSHTLFGVPGASGTEALGVNDAGLIVGEATFGSFPNGVSKGFIATPGVGGTFTFTVLTVPGATSTGISAINAHGQIVGTYLDANGVSQLFYCPNPFATTPTITTIDLSALGGSATTSIGLNDSGTIVGTTFDPNTGNTHAFTASVGGGATQADLPDSSPSLPTALFGINDAGIIAGEGPSGGVDLPFLEVSGTATTLTLPPLSDFPGADTLYVRGPQTFAINNAGQLAIGFDGYKTDAQGGQTYVSSQFYIATVSGGDVSYVAVTQPDIDDRDTRVTGLNNPGELVGYTDDGNSFAAEPACFAASSRIRTTRGEVAVEALRVGDVVPVGSRAGTRPIVWIGHRRTDCARHPRPHDVQPVRVCADAFGPGQPRRDLLLSPDHAIHAEGVLIPVRYLLNGVTVVQEAVASVTYYHVELSGHDVILAEGLPCESYLDTGNRAAFVGGGAAMLHADFSRRIWDAQGCARLVLDGPAVIAARRQLLSRAVAAGHRLTDAANMRVLADGRRLAPQVTEAGWRIALPPGTVRVRVESAVWVPAHAQAEATDTRRLGVALANIELDGCRVALDDARLGAGWHAPEPAWRWTDGDAAVNVEGCSVLGFEVVMTGRYWSAKRQRKVAA